MGRVIAQAVKSHVENRRLIFHACEIGPQFSTSLHFPFDNPSGLGYSLFMSINIAICRDGAVAVVEATPVSDHVASFEGRRYAAKGTVTVAGTRYGFYQPAPVVAKRGNCPRCGGTGSFGSHGVCYQCGGSGQKVR